MLFVKACTHFSLRSQSLLDILISVYSRQNTMIVDNKETEGMRFWSNHLPITTFLPQTVAQTIRERTRR